MSRFVLASMLFVSAVSSPAWAQGPSQPLTRQWLLEDLLPRIKDYRLVTIAPLMPVAYVRVDASIVQPGGEVRRNQVVICDGMSLKIGDNDGALLANVQVHPVEEGACGAFRDAVAFGHPSQARTAN